MKSLKSLKIIFKPNFMPLLIVIFFGLLAGKGLIGQGYFNMHDDLQMMRQLEMEKCFLDGQIPCRWVPDMGYGHGYPLFNFYPPLPYLVGQGIRLLGFSFVDTVKIVFIISFVASGVTMYFLAKEFFGRFGGIISSVFYVWAPYHAVDVYVRGAMNEAWALIWFPAILFTGYKLTTDKKENNLKWIVLLALSYFGLFTSHNLMILIFTPVFAVWILYWLFSSKNWNRIPQLILAGAWSFGLASFFTLPVFLEKGIVQTDTLVVGYYEYTAHFATIRQLLTSRFWGYGPSVWMDADDGMSFQVGWVHWGLSVFIILLVIKRFIRSKKLDKIILITLFFIAMGWFTAFMAHGRSTPIWKLFKPLEFVQFPWRFLTLVILGFSIAAGSITKLLSKPASYVVGVLLMASVLIYSWNYFLPEHRHLGPLTDEQKFTGAAWELQQTAGIFDYLPNTAKTAPKAPQTSIVELIEGDGRVESASEGTDWARFKLIVDSDESLVRINILEFPTWNILMDGQRVQEFIPEDEEWGRMYINVPKGEHEFEMELKNTTPRTAGNLFSLASWLLLAGVLIAKKRD